MEEEPRRWRGYVKCTPLHHAEPQPRTCFMPLLCGHTVSFLQLKFSSPFPF